MIRTLPLLAILAAGCRQPQAPSCTRLIACAAQLTPTARSELERAYGKDAGCWENAKHAAGCAEACAGALEALAREPEFGRTPGCAVEGGDRPAVSGEAPP